jgi:predicted nucleic-acid-binding protein
MHANGRTDEAILTLYLKPNNSLEIREQGIQSSSRCNVNFISGKATIFVLFLLSCKDAVSRLNYKAYNNRLLNESCIIMDKKKCSSGLI